MFLFYFLNCCKNCYRPATSSSRFGLEFESCDILFFKIHDHLEWYFVYIYFVKFWFSKSFEIAAVLNYNNFIFVLHRNYMFCSIHWFSFTVLKYNVLGPNLPVIKATSRGKKNNSLLPFKIDSANSDFPCFQRMFCIKRKMLYLWYIEKLVHPL